MPADAHVAVSTLLDVDPQFVELVTTLFGKTLDPEQVWHHMYTAEGIATMPVGKANPDPADLATRGAQRVYSGMRRTGRALRSSRKELITGTTAGVVANQLPQTKRRTEDVGKEDTAGVTWEVEFTKVDADKHEVFGWASIVEIGGVPVVDRQGDWISPEEIEKAAYAYVEANRKGGHQHKRDGDEPFHASNMIESFVITPEKISKMGLPEDTPCGWWVGYKVHDEDTWEKVKKGDVTGFSIHGRGKRQAVA